MISRGESEGTHVVPLFFLPDARRAFDWDDHFPRSFGNISG